MTKSHKTRIIRLEHSGMTRAQWKMAVERGYREMYWWVRLGKGSVFKFLTIKKVRGNKPFDELINLDTLGIDFGTMIYFGVGPHDIGVRAQALVLSRRKVKRRRRPRNSATLVAMAI